MNGLEATRVIRNPDSDIPDHHIPIIALTGRALISEQQECLDAGMNDCMVKPIISEILTKTIARHVLQRVSV